MKNKLVVILSITGIAALCLAATNNSQSGGLPALNERLATLESVVLAQAQEIETLKEQLAAVKPSPFIEVEVTRLKGLAGVMWVDTNPEKVWGTNVFVNASLLVRNTSVTSFSYSRGGNFTGSWTLPNQPGWTFQEPRTDW